MTPFSALFDYRFGGACLMPTLTHHNTTRPAATLLSAVYDKTTTTQSHFGTQIGTTSATRSDQHLNTTTQKERASVAHEHH